MLEKLHLQYERKLLEMEVELQRMPSFKQSWSLQAAVTQLTREMYCGLTII